MPSCPICGDLLPPDAKQCPLCATPVSSAGEEQASPSSMDFTLIDEDGVGAEAAAMHRPTVSDRTHVEPDQASEPVEIEEKFPASAEFNLFVEELSAGAQAPPAPPAAIPVGPTPPAAIPVAATEAALPPPPPAAVPVPP